MQQFNLVLYIVIISLFQLFVNFIFNYVMQKTKQTTKQSTEKSAKDKDYKLFSYILSIINTSCFMYSIYYLLVFVKDFLIPSFYDLFTTIQPII